MKLKPCPFCRSENVAPSDPCNDGGEWYCYISCRDCQSEGPSALSLELAIERWNGKRRRNRVGFKEV